MPEPTPDQPIVVIERIDTYRGTNGHGTTHFISYNADLPDGTKLRMHKGLADVRRRIRRAGGIPGEVVFGERISERPHA